MVYMRNGTLLSAYGEQSAVLPQSELFGNFHGIPSTNKSIGCKAVPALEASFDDKRQPVETLSASLFGDFIRITFLYFRMFPLHRVSILPCTCLRTDLPQKQRLPSTDQKGLLSPRELAVSLMSFSPLPQHHENLVFHGKSES